MMAKVGDMIERLKAGNLSLHEKLVAEQTTHTHALMDNNYLQRNMMNAVAEKREAVRLLGADKPKRENSAVVEELKKDVYTVTMMAGNQVGALLA